jgi:hypothetical protein
MNCPESLDVPSAAEYDRAGDLQPVRSGGTKCTVQNGIIQLLVKATDSQKATEQLRHTGITNAMAKRINIEIVSIN